MSVFKLNRREAMQSGGAVIAAAALTSPIVQADGKPAQPKDRVRVGFVGVGAKGWHHMQHLLHMEGVDMVAVCDIREARCKLTQNACHALGMPEPASYHRGEYDFRRMCDEEDLDLVYTATPWRWHVPVCLAAMRSGAHAATEIPAAITLDDCWQLVETSEETGWHLSMMENVNYRREELMILRMIREGALGELIHAEAGYMHDTRYLKIRDFGDGLWLGAHHAERNGNLYPCHGIGPMAWNFDLGRGNRMEYLVSMSSKARGMNLYASEHLPEDHPYRKRNYINGDVNSSLIQTSRGETILIKHDTDLPRPYSRTNLVQGTRGIVRGFPKFLVSLEQKAKTRGGHIKSTWTAGSNYFDQYDHPLWTFISDLAAKTPAAADGYKLADEIHTGDYLEDYRLIQALRQGVAPDFDVYDAASWSAISALSEQSVANRSQAVDFPDFTRGKWSTRKELKLMGT